MRRYHSSSPIHPTNSEARLWTPSISLCNLAFILIFVVVLVHYIRDPRPVHRDLVLVFASVVALFAMIVALRSAGIPRAVNPMSAVVLLLQPYLTLRLAGHFVRVSPSLSIASP